jgi:serine/threonine protein kinase
LRRIRSQKDQEYILKCQEAKKVDWDVLFADVDVEMVELLRGLLEYDPTKRLSAQQALQLPLFAHCHPDSLAPKELKTFEFEFEKFTLSRSIF